MRLYTRDDDPKAFDRLPLDEQKILLDWIQVNLKPRSSYNSKHTSYGLKGIIQNMTGHYFYNGEFKGAMLKSGYLPQDRTEQNWMFKVSEKSPGLLESYRRYPNGRAPGIERTF